MMHHRILTGGLCQRKVFLSKRNSMNQSKEVSGHCADTEEDSAEAECLESLLMASMNGLYEESPLKEYERVTFKRVNILLFQV